MKLIPSCILVLWSLLLVHAHAQTEPIIKGKDPLPALPKDAFTIVVIPDTQNYLGKDPVTNPNLAAQVDWILKHVQDQNIVFVTHVGDIVNKNVPEQWAVAKQHLQKLHGQVPFSLSVGNHDMTAIGNARLFQQHFPASDFSKYLWYTGSYERNTQDGDAEFSINNVNSAQRFSAGGIDFIHLSLECNAPDDVLAWAGQQLKLHQDRHAIITTHMDLGVLKHPKTKQGFVDDPKGRMRWTKNHGERGNSAEKMWEKLYRHHSNLKLILCGDQSRVTALRLTLKGEAGNEVTSLLSDYQWQPVLRLMRFIPSHEQIDVLSYDVVQQVLVDETTYVKDKDQHQFQLKYPMMSPTRE